MSDNQYVEDMLMIAARQFRYLQRAAPAGHRGYWPVYELDYKERQSTTSILPVDVDVMDMMLDMMLRAPLQIRDRRIVWARVHGGKLRAWRKVSHTCGYSHEYCRHRYYIVLQILADWLLSNG